MNPQEALQYTANGLVTGSTYVLVAVGLAIVFSTLNVVNFAHGEMFMLGGYAAYIGVINLGVPYLLSIPLAGIAVAVIGLVVERLCFRPLYHRPHVDMVLVSVGLIIVFQYSVIMIWGITARDIPTGLSRTADLFGGVVLSYERLLVILSSAVLIIMVAWFLKASMLGKAMRAIADDDVGAATVGINAHRLGALGFVSGALLAGVAGALVAPISLISPDSGSALVIKAFIILIVGGMGSVPGAIIAGLGLGVAESMLGGAVGYRYVDAFAFGLVILTLLIRPIGLFGRATRAV